MPYIGKTTDGFGVRNRFVYLASSGDTSVSGADANGATLTFTDGAYVDVYLNGVLLKPTTDYNTSTANTIAGLSALNTNDEVTVVVYDVFTVADMVSATSGGTFSGGITFGSTVSGLDVNGTEIILDADADTSITADTDDQIDIRVAGSDQIKIATGEVAFNEASGDIDFRVESNGQANMFFVDGGNNRIGVNTNSPAANHAVQIQSGGYRSSGADQIALLLGADIGDTSFTDSTRKIGGISFAHYDNDEPPFNAIRLDSQSGTSVLTLGGTGETNAVEKLQFNVATDDTDVSTMAEVLVIDKDGFFDQTANHNGDLTARFNATTSGTPYGLEVKFVNVSPDNTTSWAYNFTDSTVARFRVYSDGDVVNHDNSYGSTSDERIKQDIVDANSQWDDIKNIKIRNFKKKDDVAQYGDKAWTQIGVVAQEIEKVSPKLIKEHLPDSNDIKLSAEFGTLYKDGDTIPEGKQIGDVKEIKDNVKRVSYSVLYMKAVKALQEAMTRIETLEAKVKTLEGA